MLQLPDGWGLSPGVLAQVMTGAAGGGVWLPDPA